jgi:hypothetical protein
MLYANSFLFIELFNRKGATLFLRDIMFRRKTLCYKTNILKQKNTFPFILSVLALLVSVAIFVLSYCDSQLKNRPYVHVDFKPPSSWLYDDKGNRKIGVVFEIMNHGVSEQIKIKKIF